MDEKALKGCLVNMPCIVESQKSLDGINFFKSNWVFRQVVAPTPWDSYMMLVKLSYIGWNPLNMLKL